jgi:hypothetical protein
MDEHGMGSPLDRQHIVFLDPQHDRPVSPYTPEGEIRMMGDFAAGLSRRQLSRPLVLGLVTVILLPILVSIVAVITTWVP